MGIFSWFKKKPVEIVVLAPTDGEVIPTSKVTDEVFAQDMMGKGVAIIPTDGRFTAPVGGKLVTVFPAKHAYGIQTKEGPSILIHIGLDSVKLNGEGFETSVKQEEKIGVGDALATVHLDVLKKHNISVQSPIVVTNETLGSAKVVILKDSGNVTRGTPLFKIVF